MIERTALPMIVAAAATAVAALVASPSGGDTTRVSVSSSGEQADNPSGKFGGATSRDGRYVVFASLATNLVPDDTNGSNDVFVHDRSTGTTRRISVGPGGVEGNRKSSGPAISADGTFVSFISDATNLVPGDTNRKSDVFITDLTSGVTSLVSVGIDGADANGESQYRPAITENGRYVAFKSEATNLVTRPDTNGTYDVFVRDTVEGQTWLASVAPDGTSANGESGEPAISPTGRYVAYQSRASNLVPGDSNDSIDVFVWDLDKRKTRLVSANTEGVPGNDNSYNPSIAIRGAFVAFTSGATDLVEGDTNGKVDVFVRHADATTLESVASDGGQGNKFSGQPSISVNGRYLAYMSDSTNLVPGDTNRASDVFVRDRTTGETRLVSVGLDDAVADGKSYRPWISANGRELAFASDAANLVPDDTNRDADMFARPLR